MSVKPALRLEKRLETSRSAAFLVPVVSVVLALFTGALFFWFSGKNPAVVYSSMFYGAFGSAYGLSETVVKAIPLSLCGLGIALAFRMQLWNIGGEGQFYMGAMAATWVALFHPQLPGWIMLPAMFLAGFIAGGLWGLLPAVPRAYQGVNETITTLMLNYIAIFWVDYLVHGPWRDPAGFNFPLTAQFVPSAILPAFGTTRIHAGLIFTIAAALVMYLVMRNTRTGFEIKVIGESQSAARYAGISLEKNILLVMLFSGALCGLAGMAEVSGIAGRLQEGLSPGYGYTAIIVAWLSRLNPLALPVVAFMFGGLQVGGYSVQTSGVPATTVSMLQGLLLFFVLGGELFYRYRLSWRSKSIKEGANS
ncbi:D-allose transporter subunit [Pelotomaculum schinkii]|uniref:D-allose transporter subunit n=1 Tax=Pelotomaculum schinkii TaxID=78350 RepID=A0A4Y7R9A2_9FIRM|nr:ABC transporter permease [Pelotomaculum schinkii]TEB05535.1 D-allose transporter subunit [Pelotomaculum schinkii]